MLREQLGEKVIAQAGAEFAAGNPRSGDRRRETGRRASEAGQGWPPKRGVIADSKGRRVLVQRTGSEEARARNEAEASGYGPPRRPKRGYHGKRDLTPKDE